ASDASRSRAGPCRRRLPRASRGTRTVAAATRAPQRPSTQGITVWLTGLPSAGKTTVANLGGDRRGGPGGPAEVLDGAVVRTHLSRRLGFSRADRDENIRRIGYVAGLLTGPRVTALVADIAHYRAG